MWKKMRRYRITYKYSINPCLYNHFSSSATLFHITFFSHYLLVNPNFNSVFHFFLYRTVALLIVNIFRSARKVADCRLSINASCVRASHWPRRMAPSGLAPLSFSLYLFLCLCLPPSLGHWKVCYIFSSLDYPIRLWNPLHHWPRHRKLKWKRKAYEASFNLLDISRLSWKKCVEIVRAFSTLMSILLNFIEA